MYEYRGYHRMMIKCMKIMDHSFQSLSSESYSTNEKGHSL